MKGLTIWEPWASLIAIGAKRIETRGWDTDYRGEVAIHAAARWNADLLESWKAAKATLAPTPFTLPPLTRPPDNAFRPLAKPTTLGRIIAVAVLADCVPMENPPASLEAEFGNFGPGRFGFILADVRPLATWLPHIGQQKLWDLLPVKVERIRAAAGVAA